MTYTVPASVTVKMTQRKRLSRTAKEALSRHEKCSSTTRNGLPRSAGKPVWQTVGDKNGHGYVFSCNADAVLRRFRFCFAVFRCQYFLLPFPYIYTMCSSHAMRLLRLRHAADMAQQVNPKALGLLLLIPPAGPIGRKLLCRRSADPCAG